MSRRTEHGAPGGAGSTTFVTHPDVVLAAARHAEGLGASGGRVTSLALDMQAPTAREIVARMIDPHVDYAAVVGAALDPSSDLLGTEAGRTGELLCSLARMVGHQQATEDDVPHALALFAAARRRVPVRRWSVPDRRALAQLLWAHGEHDTLRRDAALLSSLDAGTRAFFRLDLHGEEHGVASESWLAELNDNLRAFGIDPVGLTPEGATPFDRLQPGTTRTAGPGPLITVVMPAYRPGPESITAVRSVVQQTWQDWELLVVDDASGDEFEAVFAQLQGLDPRVRVLRQPVNRGTYAARNRALEEARGEFVTFQDTDDWSHPERLERQVRPLLEDPSLLRTLSRSLRCDDDLVFQRLGNDPVHANASSHLFRRSVLDTVGRFDWVRKSADTEFDLRLEAVFPGRRLQLQEPLAFVRLQVDSLSRNDVRPGWMHPTRVEYRAATIHWHRQIEAGASPRIPADVTQRPLTAPRPFLRDVGLPEQGVDVAFVADWTMDGATQRTALAEMAALARTGLRVGLVHVRSAFSEAPRRAPLSLAARRALADRTLTFVSLEEQDHVPTIVVRQPDVLEFPTSRPVALSTDRVVVVADAGSRAAGGPGVRWVAEDCERNVETLFGVAPEWIAPDDPAHAYPRVLDVPRWPGTLPRRFRNDRPVVGWIFGGEPSALPDGAARLREVFPADGTVDVRLLGSRRVLAGALPAVPAEWLVYETGEVTARQLLHQVDVVVAFPRAVTAEALRTVEEALAEGCVPVVSPELAPHFGDAVLTCAPDEVPGLVGRLRADEAAFRERSRRGWRWADERFADSGRRVVDALGLAAPSSSPTGSP
ncbi:glycosyltransferase family 2 protein [Isoptericola sp. QY 916]|uniref:glycosyltransferase family 2 protein n=1 Tax=Isoptericola sp. QY 916 TaxID=2782570 RepID=UPI003D300ADA|nr:glycosyltransferase family 2 protein [Isoptericola sp. QY 916]